MGAKKTWIALFSEKAVPKVNITIKNIDGTTKRTLSNVRIIRQNIRTKTKSAKGVTHILDSFNTVQPCTAYFEKGSEEINLYLERYPDAFIVDEVNEIREVMKDGNLINTNKYDEWKHKPRTLSP